MDPEDIVVSLRLSPSIGRHSRSSSPVLGGPTSASFRPLTARAALTGESQLEHARRIFGFDETKKDEHMTPEQLLEECTRRLMIGIADDVRAIATLYLNSTRLENERAAPQRRDKMSDMHIALMKMEKEIEQLRKTKE